MSEVISGYLAARVRIPSNAGVHMRTLAAYPVTNEVAVELLNARVADNGDVGGAYRYVNTHNPALPIKWDPATGRYSVAAGYARHPVVGISWLGAAVFARLLGGRLPTVSEWQYAATCGRPVRYPWGDDAPSASRANYGERFGATVTVDTFPANRWGLYDMAGNAGEWCAKTPHYSDADFDRTAEYPVKGGGWNKGEAQLDCGFVRSKWGRIGTVAIGCRPVFD